MTYYQVTCFKKCTTSAVQTCRAQHTPGNPAAARLRGSGGPLKTRQLLSANWELSRPSFPRGALIGCPPHPEPPGRICV